MKCPPTLTSAARCSLGRGLLASLIFSTAALLAAGCASDRQAAAPAGSRDEPPAVTAARRDLDARYLIGPTAANVLGYRIDWQHTSIGRELKLLTAHEDSVFALDGRNYLTRLRRADGGRVWRIPVGGPLDEVVGVSYLPREERILVTTGGALMVHDAANGSQIEKQKLEKIANTRPIIYDNFAIYGSRNGQLCWHAYTVGAPWRSYQVSPSINLPPVFEDDKIVVAGSDGRVMVLLAGAARQLWSRQLLDRVVAAPVAGSVVVPDPDSGTGRENRREVVYIADLNHTLWAFALNEQRPALWRYLSEAPLTEGPVLFGDRVYQQIPGEGLVCFEALPLDAPGGVVVWRCPEVTGSVLFARHGRLFVWDDEARRLAIVDESQGGLIEILDLPAVRHLIVGDASGSELLAAADDGRVIRLVPRR